MANWALKQYIKLKVNLGNEKGSQSLEWIAIAGIVVIITGLISTAFDGSDLGDKIFSHFDTFVGKLSGD